MGENPTCCCCFSLKTGVHLIALLQFLGAIANIVTAVRTGDWETYGIQLAVQCVFSLIFVIHLIHDGRHHSNLRSALFWIYFIFITIVGSVIGYLNIFGYWGTNPQQDICGDSDMRKQMDMDEGECENFVLTSLLIFVTIHVIFHLYCSCKLKEWHNYKVNHPEQYGALSGGRN